jgi:hypothetical protein
LSALPYLHILWRYEVVSILAKVKVTQQEEVDAIDEQRQAPQEMHFEHAEADNGLAEAESNLCGTGALILFTALLSYEQ